MAEHLEETILSTDSDETGPAVNDGALFSDRYRLQGELGEGAMGQVYRAEHILMKKQVAIKVLHSDLSDDEEIVARFHREARAAASLDHPNVCRATDFGQNEEGAFFLVMEYLEGSTLQETLEIYGKIDVDRALHITLQVTAALEQAHQAGIVHRDLKPENIMLVDRQGDVDTVKIMDFGIARLLASTEDGDAEEDTSARLTRKGMVYGTPHYMSPEQVAGDDVDARTDIYALGVVLFEMLTGSPPYDGDNIARVMGQHITSPIPSISERCPTLQFPAALERLVEQLLAKDAEDRPQRAAQIIDEIHRITAAPEPDDANSSSLQNVTRNLEATTRRGVHRAGEVWNGLATTERWLIAGISTLSIFLLLTTAVIFMALVFGSGERQAEAINDDRQILMEDEAVISALEDAATGDRSGLDELLEARGDDPHLRYLALEADLEADRSVNIIEKATEILSLDGRYAHEPILVNELVERITSNTDGEAAIELLSTHINQTIRDALAKKAWKSERSTMRDTAFNLLQETDQLRSLAPWKRSAAELRQAHGCSEHKEKINDLVATGDPQAIEVLEIYQAIPRRGCGQIRLTDCYGCIRDDLSDAVDTLRKVQ